MLTKHIFGLYDLDIWPKTLTYNPSLVKVDPHTKNQGQSSNGEHESSDRHADTRTLPSAPCFAIDKNDVMDYSIRWVVILIGLLIKTKTHKMQIKLANVCLGATARLCSIYYL